jgi:hypothetical protein
VSARTFNTRVLYVNWDSFQQNEIDDSIANLESTTSDNDPENKEGAEQTKQLPDKIRALQSKVGMTCVVDLAFIANAVMHCYQETADWFDDLDERMGYPLRSGGPG